MKLFGTNWARLELKWSYNGAKVAQNDANVHRMEEDFVKMSTVSELRQLVSKSFNGFILECHFIHLSANLMSKMERSSKNEHSFRAAPICASQICVV